MCIWGKPEGVRNKALVSFQDESKGYRIWKGGRWSIRGYLINFKRWTGDKATISVSHEPWSSGSSCMASLGTTCAWKLQNLLQDRFCLNCGMIGHARRECNNLLAMSTNNLDQPKYNPEISVNRARPLNSIEEDEQIGEETQQWSEESKDSHES
ncbi:hypothetical protein PIB30_072471 [Stylosanthes scabra]|uniref:CCHC-type domain-containing protein n=1 Tax=Stylosanthes scabra TaxID=79078 RepID=A0ABU6QQ41_9FABA|nr:hypothetical protein [Stylosanthes scabra]